MMTEELFGDAVQKVISAMFYRQESPAVQWDGAKRHRSDKPSASINEERAKMIDLMEYQDKKQRKEKPNRMRRSIDTGCTKKEKQQK